MKRHNKISTDIALLVFLAIVVAFIIFPILGKMPMSQAEAQMLQMRNVSGGIGSIFTGGLDPFFASYMCVAGLIQGLLPLTDQLFALRLPGAVVVFAMTLCLFRFDGDFDRLNASFLASLLFLSSMVIVTVTFQATSVLVPTALFVFAMMSLYHWLHHQSKRYFWLVVFSAAVATMIIGVTAPIAMGLMAYVFIAGVKTYRVSSYVEISAALVLACAVAFLSVYSLSGDVSVAMNMFNIHYQVEALPFMEDNMLLIFMETIIFGLFPWSIPLLISLPWLIKNPRWVVSRFKSLDLLQRYGIIIFLFSLPSLFFYVELSKILLITSVFFNMPLIGRYLLMQFSNHPNVWRITGAISATVVGLGASAFVALQSGMTLHLLGYTIERDQCWSGWSIFITISIFISLYTLWRNVREIGNNNRYLYNIILLYLLAIVLTFGYILP